MNRIIACTIALALATTPLCAQDIPLSKILVEKDQLRRGSHLSLPVSAAA